MAQKELLSLQEVQNKTEAEIFILQEQRDNLSTRLHEEKGRNSILDQQKNSLQEFINEKNQKLVCSVILIAIKLRYI